MFSYNPHQYRCCQHNVAFGWPYYAERSWMATPGNGLAAVFYVASEVSAKVGDGTAVRITQTTDYPFDETVDFAMTAPKPVRFPLTLRLPAWRQQPRLNVNGQPMSLGKAPRGWVVVEREWAGGDKVRLELAMRIAPTVWARNRNTVSVNLGPLTYSLRIGERWEKKGGTQQWPGLEVHPATPWKYGLIVDAKDPAASFEVVRKKGPLAPQPFAFDAAPIALRARGKRIPRWTQEPNGMAGEVQPGPVRSSEPADEITLIPMGSREWGPAPPLVLASTASHSEPLQELNGSAPRFTWSDKRGTPARWKSAGHRTPRAPAGRPRRGRCCTGTAAGRVRFVPVETTRIRVKVEMQERSGAGIVEMRVTE